MTNTITVEGAQSRPIDWTGLPPHSLPIADSYSMQFGWDHIARHKRASDSPALIALHPEVQEWCFDTIGPYTIQQFDRWWVLRFKSNADMLVFKMRWSG
jgi:hypothetical protein